MANMISCIKVLTCNDLLDLLKEPNMRFVTFDKMCNDKELIISTYTSNDIDKLTVSECDRYIKEGVLYYFV